MKDPAEIFQEAMTNIQERVDALKDGSNKDRLRRRMKGLQDTIDSIVLDVRQAQIKRLDRDG